MPIIRFENVAKSYGEDKQVIANLNFSIYQGELIILIGPSGCGKTTILKMINGLLKPDQGFIYINGKEIGEWDIVELRRKIGYVIQQIGLFPHLTIAENIGYVLELKEIDKALRLVRAQELIKLVGLDESYLDQYPAQLSGGQKQRVGVARALAADPDIILMDEPFGATDEITRKHLQDELLTIHSTLGKTIIFVTHDIEEAFKLGSRIALIQKGKIVQHGTKEEMMFSPKDQFVGEFFGCKNFVAFLTTTQIIKVVKLFPEDEVKPYISADIPFVSSESSIMEGIKVMFDYGVDSILVVGGDTILGEFRLSTIQKYYIQFPVENLG